MNDDKFAEILVRGNEDSSLAQGDGQDFVIAGIDGPISRPDDVVTGRLELGACTTPYAGVKQKLYPSPLLRARARHVRGPQGGTRREDRP